MVHHIRYKLAKLGGKSLHTCGTALMATLLHSEFGKLIPYVVSSHLTSTSPKLGLLISIRPREYSTCPRQEVSGNRGDPRVGVLYGTKSVLI